MLGTLGMWEQVLLIGKQQPLPAGTSPLGRGWSWGRRRRKRKVQSSNKTRGGVEMVSAEPHDLPLLGRLGASEIASW